MDHLLEEMLFNIGLAVTDNRHKILKAISWILWTLPIAVWALMMVFIKNPLSIDWRPFYFLDAICWTFAIICKKISKRYEAE